MKIKISAKGQSVSRGKTNKKIDFVKSVLSINQKIIFMCLLVFIFWLGFGAKASAATYNIGPGQTYGTFTALVAAINLAPDDIVDGGGNTFSETWTVNGSGTSGHVITLSNAIISGGIDGNSKDYLRITRARVNGPIILSGAHSQVDHSISDYSTGNGLTISGGSNVVYNVDVNGAAAKGIDAQESSTIKNIIIRNTNDANLNIATGKTVTGSNNQFEDTAQVGSGTYTDTGNPWASSNPKQVSTFDRAPSGAWTFEYPQYRNNVIGWNYNTSHSTAFSDSFTEADGQAEGWTVKRGSFAVSGNSYTTIGSPVGTMSIPMADYSNWGNYRFSAKITRLGAPDAYGYTSLYFRSTMNGTNDSGYVVDIRQTGTINIYRRDNGTNFELAAGMSVAKDNNQHTIIITVVGSVIKLWLDKSEDLYPDVQVSDSTYATGTIGVGSHAWNSVFDDISITPILTVTPTPTHLYTNGTSTLIISALATLDNLSVVVTDPDGNTYAKNNPTGCSGQSSCVVNFPTDFTGLSISTLGIYKITATNGSDESYVVIEVRETPLVTFFQLTDTHVINSGASLIRLTNVVSAINNQKFFSLPNFVVITGDVTEGGTLDQISISKVELDKLTVPYYALPDEHDFNSESGDARGANWVNTFGEGQCTQSWTCGNYLFMAIQNAVYCGYGSSQGSDENKTWMTSVLAANPGKYGVLFSHRGLQSVRTGGSAENYWLGSYYGADQLRTILEANGNVLANFSGHSHINGNAITNGILYQQTSGFTNCNEYRYVEIYADRVESQMIPTTPIYSQNYSGAYWSGSTDSTHTASLYSFGLPYERRWRFDVSARNLTLDYHLHPTSSAIDSGADVYLTSDFAGNPIYGTSDIGGYEYQPTHDMAKVTPDEPQIGEVIRVYGDGKFRNTVDDSGDNDTDTAKLSIVPQGGTNTTKWLDLNISTWDTSGNYRKHWTENGDNLEVGEDITNTLHTVGDLEADKYYNVSVDGTLAASSITGADCTDGVCKSDEDSQITFTYTGGYTSHTFDVTEGDNTPPTVTNGTSPKFHTDTTQVTLSLTTDENSTCRYSTDQSDVYDDMTAFSTTGELNHSTTVTNLSPGDFTYYAICRDTVGNDTSYTLSFEIAPRKNDTGTADASLKNGQNDQTLDEDKKFYFDQDEGKLKGQDETIADGTVKIYKEGKKYATVDVDSDGNWSKKMTFNHNKTYTLKLKFYDQYGTLRDTKEYDVKVDTEKPIFTDPFPETLTIQKEQPINFPATDEDTGVDYYKIKLLDQNGHILRAWREQEKSAYFIPEEAFSQATTIIVRAYDKAGNYAEEEANLQIGNNNASPNVPETSTSGSGEGNTADNTNASPNACSYTVQDGDTLWDIAKKVYGDATAYPLIIEKNKDKYPDINSNLAIGQELVFGCENNQSENTGNNSNINNSNQQPQAQSQSQSQSQSQTQSSTFKWWNPFTWF